MPSKIAHWIKMKQLRDVVEIAEEMQKWCEYLAHSAKQGDQKEVIETLERMEELFNKAKGE
jgi:phage shock protein A